MTSPTQILYVLVSSNGDGSSSALFTLDAELIEKLRQADRKGLTSADGDPGVDGDGFHYSEVTLPASVTKESLGSLNWLEEHWRNKDFSMENHRALPFVVGFDSLMPQPGVLASFERLGAC